MCLSPITLKKTYRGLDGSMTDKVPCSRCAHCYKRRQNAWSFRLSEEQKISQSACFLTLTYENPPQSFNGLPTLRKRDYQNFMKRLRKKMPDEVKPKYYAVGEYGTRTKRPHYHAIMFNLPQDWIVKPQKLLDTWSHGHIDIGSSQMASIHYVTGYIQKGRWEPEADYDDRIPEFPLMSKKMGLNHLTPQMIKYYKSRLQPFVTMEGGIKMPMPRYFRDKIYTKTERIIMRESVIAAQSVNWEKMFNNSYLKESQWKNDEIRRDLKKQKFARLGI